MDQIEDKQTADECIQETKSKYSLTTSFNVYSIIIKKTNLLSNKIGTSILSWLS